MKKNPQWRQVLWRRQKTRRWAFFSWAQEEKRDTVQADQSRTWFRYGAPTVHWGLGSRIGECAGLRKRISAPWRQHSRGERCCYFENGMRWRIGGFGGSFHSQAVGPWCPLSSHQECGCPPDWRGENSGKSVKRRAQQSLRFNTFKPHASTIRKSRAPTGQTLRQPAPCNQPFVGPRRGTAFIRCGHGLAVQVNMKKSLGMVAKDRSGCNTDAQKMQRNVRN